MTVVNILSNRCASFSHTFQRSNFSVNLNYSSKIPMSVEENQVIVLRQKSLWIEAVLGRGSFGRVYKAIDLATLQTYAVKEIICQPTSPNTVGREIGTMSKARHMNIVQILAFGSKLLPNGNISYLLAQEYCPGGNLNSRLDQPSSLEKNLTWMIQLSDACSFLHSLIPPIVHRDLKPDNIMLDQNENLKLGDFGLAREYPSTITNYYMTLGVGTLYWMAPEIFRYGQHYTEKADIFSLGTIFNAILTRECIEFSETEKRVYGAFATDPTDGNVIGLGHAMACVNPTATVQFASIQGPLNPLMQLILNMLDYYPNNRPSACLIKTTVEYIYQSLCISQFGYLAGTDQFWV